MFGINGLGQETLIGETTFLSSAALSAWPLPYRGRDLQISFTAASGRGGGPGLAEIILFDAQGRRVRTIERDHFEPGAHSAQWDGLDESGRRVAAGLYFLRSRSWGEQSQLKVVVVH